MHILLHERVLVNFIFIISDRKMDIFCLFMKVKDLKDKKPGRWLELSGDENVSVFVINCLNGAIIAILHLDKAMCRGEFDNVQGLFKSSKLSNAYAEDCISQESSPGDRVQLDGGLCSYLRSILRSQIYA